jgi:hypothetical protein
MTLDDQIQACRSLNGDTAAPFLWSDEEWTLYLNEAQREAAERGQLILDVSTPAVVEINVVAGTRTYPLHPSIIKIKRAKLDLGDRPLIETSATQMDEGGTGWFPSGLNAYAAYSTWYPGGSNWETLTGNPERFIQNGDQSITLIRIPIADDVLRMRVTRLPLVDMVDDDDEPEIASRYHFRALDWARHLAYLKQDPDALDQNKAAALEQSFTAAFGVRPDANVQRKRREGGTRAVRMGAW